MRVWLRRIGIGVGILLGVLVLAAGGAYTYGGHLDTRTVTLPDASAWVPVAPPNETVVARGEHLATAIGKCVECHGVDLGGTKFIDDPALGRLPASNLTTGKGGVLRRYNDAALERVIRHGIKVDGTPAFIMPAEDYQFFTDEDVMALIAYIRSRPAVDREQQPKNLHFLARALVTGGVIKYPYDIIDHTRKSPASLRAEPTADYGRYIANVGGCTGCHGPGLSGGKQPGAPPEFKPPANITPGGIGTWTEADFFRALREGIRPGGTPIDTQMPWRLTKKMTDDEIKAVYAFLKTVPAREYGNR
jgi:mono/diheme cytochrome c family protein